jgi:hypothetical protein
LLLFFKKEGLRKMTDEQKTAAIALIAQAIEDLVDGISADEVVSTQAMSLALGKRVAGLCTDHADGRRRVEEVARGLGASAATFINAKLGEA